MGKGYNKGICQNKSMALMLPGERHERSNSIPKICSLEVGSLTAYQLFTKALAAGEPKLHHASSSLQDSRRMISANVTQVSSRQFGQEDSLFNSRNVTH